LQTDPDRVKPVLEMPAQKSRKELLHVVGKFACCRQWTPCHYEKVKPLIVGKRSPLGSEALQALEMLKGELAEVSLGSIDEKVPFVLQTDASENAISANLTQQYHPMVFFRILTKNENFRAIVEKETLAIVEAVRK